MSNTVPGHLVRIEGQLYSHARARLAFRKICHLYESMGHKFVLLRLIDIAFARYQLDQTFISQSLVNCRIATIVDGRCVIDELTLALVRELDREYDLHGQLRQYVFRQQDVRHELSFPFAIIVPEAALPHGGDIAPADVEQPDTVAEPVLPSGVWAYLQSL